MRRARQVICRDAPFVGSNSPAAEDTSTEQQQQQQVVPDFFSPQALAASVGAPAVPLAAATVGLSSHTAAADAHAFVDPDAANPRYNKSGLNGLTVGSTTGLTTVSRGRQLWYLYRSSSSMIISSSTW